MSIYKRTEGLILTTNLSVSKEDLNGRNLKVSDILAHLNAAKPSSVHSAESYADLIWVCNKSMDDMRNDVIELGPNSISLSGSKARATSHFHPSCRIIRINISEANRATRVALRSITNREIEEGYNMRLDRGYHAAVIIKIEHMTRVSCLATWTLIR